MRILIVDATLLRRAHLQRFLVAQPDVAAVAVAASAREGFAAASDCPVNVAIVDDYLPDRDGLTLARQLHNLRHPPRILIYSASPDARLAIAALVAGADGLCDQTLGHADVWGAVRAVARGVLAVPTIEPDSMRAVAAHVDRGDLPILGMLVNRVAPADIAAILDISTGALEARRSAILQQLAASPHRLSADHRHPRPLTERGGSARRSIRRTTASTGGHN